MIKFYRVKGAVVFKGEWILKPVLYDQAIVSVASLVVSDHRGRE